MHSKLQSGSQNGEDRTKNTQRLDSILETLAKMYRTKMSKYGLDSCGSGYCSAAADSGERSNEHSGFTKGGEFLD